MDVAPLDLKNGRLMQWNGKWSDHEAARDAGVARTLQAECDHDPAADDGVFCIEFRDLLRNFRGARL